MCRWVWVVIAVGWFVPGLVAAERPPNLVILLADDLGYGELGCQGNEQIPTPHIDSIARRGVRLTDGYVTAAFCSPSRAGLITGRYQTRFGYEFNPIGAQNEDPRAGLPRTETTLAEVLRDAGYATALIGKWHLGGAAPYHPQRRGFDEFFGFLHEGHFYVPAPYEGVTTMLRRRAVPGGNQRWISPDGKLILSTHMGHNEPAYDANNPILRDGQPVVEMQYLTDAFTREATGFIERNRSRPFFLFVSYNAVHSPLQAADNYLDRFADIEDIHRRIFAGMLSNLDDSVGAILQKLRNQQLEGETLVVFLSDHGGPTRELTSSNAPLRGGKGDLYEGGIRIPFLLQWPGVLPEGATYRHPVISLDLFPTAVELAGADHDTRALDGVALLPYLTGEKPPLPQRTLFWRANRRAALRHGDWKLVRNPQRGADGRWQLYDLAEDVAEANDLAEKRPETLHQLIEKWEGINQQMREPFWEP